MRIPNASAMIIRSHHHVNETVNASKNPEPDRDQTRAVGYVGLTSQLLYTALFERSNPSRKGRRHWRAGGRASRAAGDGGCAGALGAAAGDGDDGAMARTLTSSGG